MNPDEIRSRLDILRRARDSGVLTIRHGDSSTSYRDLDEIEKVIRTMERELAIAEGRPRARRVGYITQLGKGL